ncbi:MAG: hypothetical protein ACM30G_14560, partial [Micromonosporaceae bacterium]
MSSHLAELHVWRFLVYERFDGSGRVAQADHGKVSRRLVAPLAVAVGVLTVGLLIAAPKIRLGAAPENASNAGGEPAAG